MASSFVRVMFSCLQLDARRESLCLTRRCDALTLPFEGFGTGAAAAAGGGYMRK